MEPGRDTLVLAYDADGGLGAKLLDAVKKAIGREECPLCEITYTPIGKRGAWTACEARLGIPVVELHRDEIPADWRIERDQLPCVLRRIGEAVPAVLLSRAEISGCQGDPAALEARISAALRASSA